MIAIYSHGCRWRRCKPFTNNDGGGAGLSHLLPRMEVEEVLAIYSHGYRWRSCELFTHNNRGGEGVCKPFTHKDVGGEGEDHLLTRMQVEHV